jgi:hypothetical protein
MNKAELLSKLKSSHQQMLEAIGGLKAESMLEPGVTGQWCVKDILNHISHWEAELVTHLWWVQQGQKPAIKSYSIEEIDQLNHQWYEEDLERSLEMVTSDFKGVRKQTIRRVEALSEDNLTKADRFPWMKGKPLAELIASYSFEHDLEHIDQIRNWRLQKGI